MIVLWSVLPMLYLMIYLIYQEFTGGSINMDATIIAALIGVGVSFVGLFVEIYRTRRQDKQSFERIEEKIEERHTSAKAKDYLNRILSDLRINKMVTDTSQKKIENIDKNLYDVIKDMIVVKKNIERYEHNLNKADLSINGIKGALSTLEKTVEMNGVLSEENQTLKKENKELKTRNRELTMQNEKLLSTISKLQSEIEINDHSQKRNDDLEL